MRTALDRLKVIPTALVAALAIATSAAAEVQTPISAPITVRGNSGGSQSSNCGNIPSSPNEVVQVTGSAANIRVRVEGQGQPTLLIRGLDNPICLLADNGSIEFTGRLEPRTYSIFVGNRASGGQPFTLSISQD